MATTDDPNPEPRAAAVRRTAAAGGQRAASPVVQAASTAPAIPRPKDSRFLRDLQGLALRVDRMVEERGATRLALLGMGRGVGVSTLVLGLGEALAAECRRVLLVDAGWQAPRLHRALGQPLTPGLCDLLAARAVIEDVRHVVRENLTLVPAGEAHGSPAGSTHTWRKLLLDLGAGDELMLVDAGCAQLPASVAVASAADAAVLVVAAGRVKWDAVAATVPRLAALGVVVAGVVLNKRRFPVPGLFYGVH